MMDYDPLEARKLGLQLHKIIGEIADITTATISENRDFTPKELARIDVLARHQRKLLESAGLKVYTPEEKKEE